MSRQQSTDFLTDLFERRGRVTIGHNPIRFLELWGASLIEPTAFEPDPTTHRQDFYYNAKTNTLYKKVITQTNPIVAHWQKASN